MTGNLHAVEHQDGKIEFCKRSTEELFDLCGRCLHHLPAYRAGADAMSPDEPFDPLGKPSCADAPDQVSIRSSDNLARLLEQPIRLQSIHHDEAGIPLT